MLLRKIVFISHPDMKPKQKSDLKTRVMTAILFGIVSLFLIIYSDYSRIIFLGLVAVLSSMEYLKMAGRDLWVSLLVPLSLFLLTCSYFSRTTYEYEYIYLIACMVYALFGFVALYKRNYLKLHDKLNLIIAAVSIVFPMSLAASNIIKQGNQDPLLLLYIVLLIWASDTFAYLVGRKIGKHKLMPRVSPGKTIEGSIGGGVFTIGVAIIIATLSGNSLFHYFCLGLIIWIAGTIGDLVESSIKRHFGVKDSGSMLPGHGGFWDRFDSFIYVIPFVLLIQSLINI